MDAGELRERVELLTLAETADGFSWAVDRKLWAKVEITGKKNLFSAVGIGARDVKLTIRATSATLHHAIRYKGQHLFLTEITTPERGWMELRAALVDVVDCVAGMETSTPGPHFPGVRTEKYLGFVQRDPQTENTTRYVLVTPKAIDLAIGSLVQVADETLVVQVSHTLDAYKNEYEVGRSFEP